MNIWFSVVVIVDSYKEINILYHNYFVNNVKDICNFTAYNLHYPLKLKIKFFYPNFLGYSKKNILIKFNYNNLTLPLHDSRKHKTNLGNETFSQ